MKSLRNLVNPKSAIDNHTLVRVLTVILIYALGVAFVWQTRQVWVLLIVAFFLALALNPPVSYLSKRILRGRRGVATGIAYIVVLTILGGLLFTTLPPLVNQSQQLFERLPSYISNLESSNSGFARFSRRVGLVEELKRSQPQLTSKAGGPIFNFFRKLSSSLLSVVAVLGLTFFMLVEGPRWLQRFWSLQPRGGEQHRKVMAQRMYRAVTGYVNGQLLIALIAAISAFIIMSILGVPFALPLAAFVGIFGLIPLIGATLGAILVVTVGLFQSLATGLILLIFFVIYQQFENYVLYPRIQAKKLEISPLMVLVAAIMGASLAGLLGALLAIPAVACMRILAADYIAKHHMRHKEPA